VVILTFTDFCIESSFDYVTIYDGDSASSYEIARITGCNVAPATYASSQCNMFIRFTSDYNVVFRGFNATYTAAPGNKSVSLLFFTND
jgi:hypothetical protein